MKRLDIMHLQCRLTATLLFLSSIPHIQIPAGGFSTSERSPARSVVALDGIGITSLLVLPPPPDAESEENGAAPRVLVGTKRGALKELRIDRPPNRKRSIDGWTARDIVDTSAVALKPYPIYSMLELGGRVLTGGGDRYVTVWNETSPGRLSISQRLGPHTGWVKDLAAVATPGGDKMLCSIGCNCVEVWSNEAGRFEHVTKLQVDSSVESGCTLSSDLLCLEACTANGMSYLLAGGVDGRIHCWSLDGREFRKEWAASCHDDRVNDLVLLEEMNLLVTVGNDGFVKCHEMESSLRRPFHGLASSYHIDSRISCISVIREVKGEVYIVVGTAGGSAVRFKIARDSRGGVEISNENSEIVLVREPPSKQVTVHALSAFGEAVFVGHSNGLSLWSIHNDLAPMEDASGYD